VQNFPCSVKVLKVDVLFSRISGIVGQQILNVKSKAVAKIRYGIAQCLERCNAGIVQVIISPDLFTEVLNPCQTNFTQFIKLQAQLPRCFFRYGF
jgi:hypothetical protein